MKAMILLVALGLTWLIFAFSSVAFFSSLDKGLAKFLLFALGMILNCTTLYIFTEAVSAKRNGHSLPFVMHLLGALGLAVMLLTGCCFLYYHFVFLPSEGL